MFPGMSCTVQDLTQPKTTRLGKESLTLSKKVTIKGPRGELSLIGPDFLKVEVEDSVIRVSVQDEDIKTQKTFWGTFRKLISNNTVGCFEGHKSMLKLVGTGYRAFLEEKDGKPWVVLKVGASINQGLPVPEGVVATVPVPNRVFLEGNDLQVVKQYAAKLRAFRKPEPYKGKGIYVDDETIKIKDKKVK
ncbi:hypothetical protein BABINDRAFT_162784 [Babjeviella inositovora NRRL Y-12698]|uniref:Large ribosomal subunit protein uL6 alpha-beta domain-containing protein n=1 Tax=Babjeviella inositovora NRRL Y-12698 TaxID=984486 RepID=A0A1E3QLK0_9ASCO|nr:uncharacterized protein BABINDRAFT_162784 [Babjeviella inositovora NRRL Y-12698]ODQ78579.1 hypothetical protein BABINDRAFT_162784 [Babjeviella inositovora NRRL Y-12698]